VNLLVDTSAWSLLLRRRQTDTRDPMVRELRGRLEAGDCVHLVGCILQELLDGVKSAQQFDLLAEYLEPFPLIAPERADYVEAARLKNLCRSKGVQAGTVDFLIAATCIRRNYPLLSADEDFQHIARHCELVLLGGGRVSDISFG